MVPINQTAQGLLIRGWHIVIIYSDIVPDYYHHHHHHQVIWDHDPKYG
jgi:hypothetical protein